MSRGSSKKANKRLARKRSLRLKHSPDESSAKSDSMRAARRYYGQGQGLDG